MAIHIYVWRKANPNGGLIWEDLEAVGIAAGWRRQWALVLHWRRWAELDTQEMVRAGQITQLMPFHVHPKMSC